MRIALIAHHVAPIAPPFAGGVESFTWYLARRLARRGHEVTLFAPCGTHVPGVEVHELELDPDLSPSARADVSMPPAAFMAAHHAYQGLMMELAQGRGCFDLVHSHSLHYLPVAMAPLLDTPSLLTLHTPPTPWLESALRAQEPGAPHLSAVSGATARMWAPIATVEDVVPNGVDLAAWEPGPGGHGAVWTGRMVPEKAPHLAIDAARRAGMELVLAGPLVDAVYWEAEVAPRLGADVRYAGHLGHAELARLVGASAVAVATPTWEEPFGLSAAEAIAAGTPVAAFARGGLTDVVFGEAGRLAPAGDVERLAGAMVAAAGQSRARVRAHAERHLGIDAMVTGYERLYARALDLDPAAGVLGAAGGALEAA
jgi:glycosyltransferase involved in cell wall biosynthesis